MELSSYRKLYIGMITATNIMCCQEQFGRYTPEVLMTKFGEIMLYQIYPTKLDTFIGFQDHALVPGRIYPT
jgi:hypothetical protein